MRKSKVSIKSALVLTLFTANVIHSSGVVPVISEGIRAYADVYYSYNPDDECGVNGDSKQKNGKGDDALDSSSSNSVSAGSLEDTIWTKQGTTAYKNALDTVNLQVLLGILGELKTLHLHLI